MRKSIAFIIISLMTVCVTAQNLYIGSFYVTTNTEEKLYGDGKDKWTERQVHISNLFRYEQPDVLGLQGATTTQQSAIRSKINSGLTSVLTYKLAQNILYNKTVELDTCNMVENMPEGSTCSWAKMRKDGKAFYVFNFCFSTENSIATSSASRVRTAIDEINTEGLPVLIVGDLGVNVDLCEKDVLLLFFKLLKDRRERPAGGAPVGVKNEHDQPAVGAYGVF